MQMSARSYSPLSLAPLLLIVLLGNGGCVAAGLAAVGPMLGSITALGDRTVERTIPADLSTTWGATVDALARMAVRVEQTEKTGNRWQLTGIEGDVTVYGTLERVTPSMTKLSIRVEAGSIYADKGTGEELLNQVGVSLASLTGSGPRGAPLDGRRCPRPRASGGPPLPRWQPSADRRASWRGRVSRQPSGGRSES